MAQCYSAFGHCGPHVNIPDKILIIVLIDPRVCFHCAHIISAYGLIVESNRLGQKFRVVRMYRKAVRRKGNH